jgi:uncharacterized delta-60 repeat protein
MTPSGRALRFGSALTTAAFAVLLLAPVALAVAGALDPSFSGDGKARVDLQGDEGATSLAIQADGKILLAGSRADPVESASDIALVRLTPDGSLDSTFGVGGAVLTDLGFDSEQANDVALQSDGRIVVVGSTGVVHESDIAVIRYDANGVPDPSFNGGGVQFTDIAGGSDFGNGVAIQGDDKIVVIGFTETTITEVPLIAVVRYKTDGTLDPTFAGDGMRTIKMGLYGYGDAIAIQPNGKIVVVGRAAQGFHLGQPIERFAVARLNSDGSMDSTFSGDGRAMTAFGASARASDVVLQSNGKIVAVGRDTSDQGRHFALTRYLAGGTLDRRFSGDGKQIIDFAGNDEEAGGVSIQPNGKIIVAGFANGNERARFALARLTPLGRLDSTFSRDGKQTTAFGLPTQVAYAFDVALQSDGRIVAAGQAFAVGGFDFAATRYLRS